MASSPVWFGRLLSNSGEVLEVAVDVILKYVDNILAHPDDPKYRSIRLENKAFKSRVLPARGSLDCLKAMGFEQDPDYVVLPRNADLQKLRAMRQSLVERRYVEPASSLQQPGAPVRHMPQVSPQQTQEFLQRVTHHAEHVLVYEDQNLQLKARSCMPMDRLHSAAEDSAQQVAELSGEDEVISKQECLLLELMHWFKEDFFSWCDAPECERCGAPPAKMQSVGLVSPSSDDLRYGASQVEGYRCTSCGSSGRFPRYNHPGRLLETRKGRCGEWANCFTLCCRALGFEARHVVDWTDHVWTEVFSDRQQRWLHCDPCEDCCDKPLLYEGGWGKSLSYVLAFSCEDAVDVTWRYTVKSDDVRTRRVLCDENALQRCLDGIRAQRQRSLGEARKQELLKYRLIEVAEFLSEKSVDADVAGQGRVSGSAAWRLARGEVTEASVVPGQKASGAVPTTKVETSYIFEPLDADLSARRMRVRYSAASDGYFRRHAEHLAVGDSPELRGWKAGVLMAENVQRKVENDWKMAYLARRTGGSEAAVTWTLDVSSSPYVIASACVRVKGDVYGSGVLSWSVSADNGELVEFGHGSHGGPMAGLAGATMVTVTANMHGGDGDVAWQHTQLFRQSSEEKHTCPLDIDLVLKDP